MNKLATLCTALALVACKAGTPTETDDTDTPEACDITVVSTDPGTNEVGVYYRSTLEVVLTAADPSATLTVTADGQEVPGTATVEDDTVTFVPDTTLVPGTDHLATVTLCDGERPVNIPFTVSTTGMPLTPASLQNTTYLLDLGSGIFVEPPGVGPLLSSQINVDILLGILSADDTEVSIVGALGEEGASPPAQDLCSPTIDFPVADFTDNPFFAVGPDDVTVEVQGFQVAIDDLFVSGAFSPDGSEIQGAVLQGSLDTRNFVDLVEPGGPDDAVCALAAGFSITCEPCPTGDGDFCLSLVVDSLQANATGGQVVLRSAEDIENDTVCTPPPEQEP